MKQLKGKNVLITGAASGIGRLMSMKFAGEGANVAMVDINRDSLAKVEAEVKAAGPSVKTGTYTCDISKSAEVAKTAAAVRKDFGQVDVLINNAGVVAGKAFLDMSLDEMEHSMSVNYWGHTYFTKEFLGEMTKRNGGNIVNVASSSGLLGMPLLTDYAASKFAEVGFSEALRRELKKFGYRNVHITCVCPYFIDTGMFKGCKPMVLSPFVKPETAASAIVKGVKKDKPYVMLPAMSIRGSMILKLLPTSFFDFFLAKSGGDRAMDNFVGRK